MAAPASTASGAIDFGSRHPHYVERAPIWTWNRAHWNGGRALIAGQDEYLPKFQLENEANYSRRKLRAGRIYHNLVRGAIQVYVSQLFRRDPERQLPESWKPFLDDVDMQGTRSNRFFKDTARRSMRDGICFVLVESPASINENTSEADAQDLRLRPWFERIEAARVIDWDVERIGTNRGRLNWVVIKDDTFAPRAPFGSVTQTTRYRLYTRSEIRFYEEALDAKGKATQQVTLRVPNRIGEVPLVAVYDEMVAPMQGATIIDDVALIANALWNSASVADEAYHYQGFSLLTIVSDAELSEIKIGEDRGLKLPSGSTAEYITPSAAPFVAHETRARDMIERVTDLVFQRTSRQLPTAQVESADKRGIDREEFMALLEERAAGLEAAETACWKLFAKYAQLSDPELEKIRVLYNRKFKADARTVQDWQILVAEGIYGRTDWYTEEHPGTTRENALVKIEENLQAEKDLSPMSAAEEAAGEAAGAAFDALASAEGEGATSDGGAAAGNPAPIVMPTPQPS